MNPNEAFRYRNTKPKPKLGKLVMLVCEGPNCSRIQRVTEAQLENIEEVYCPRCNSNQHWHRVVNSGAFNKEN